MNSQLRKDELIDKLLNGTDFEIDEIVEDIQPADILDVIHEHEDLIYKLLERLPDSKIADILEVENEEDVYPILKGFPNKRQKNILRAMSSDDVTDLVEYLEEIEADDILKKIYEEGRDDIKDLLCYTPDTAGGIMATEFISIAENKSVRETLEYLQKYAPDGENSYNLYVVDKDNILKGVVSLKDIACSDFDTRISSLTNKKVISIPYYADQEDVARAFEKYGFMTMPVVNEYNKLLGIITLDDIIHIIKNEDTEDIHRLASVDEEERLDGSLAKAIGSRLPWLLIKLIATILSISVVGLFESTIEKVVVLAVFIPLISIMGEHAATQSLTIAVRGIALGELKGSNAKSIFRKEALVGAITGLIIGSIVSVLGFIWKRNIMFGIIVGISMIINMIIATISGFLIPALLRKFKLDPALTSPIFVTTLTDIFGFLVFLGLATIFIRFII